MKPQIIRKLLAIFWVVVVLAAPLSARAQFTFTTNNGTLTLTHYTGADSNVTIPDVANAYPVTSIAVYAFYSQTNLGVVNIPATVTNIDRFAFFQCSKLKMIVVDAGNQSYASVVGVLFDKTLTTLVLFPTGYLGGYVIPDSVTNIADSAFQFCGGLTNVRIDTNVSRIGLAAFETCSNLVSIMIPDSVTEMGDYVFSGCSSVTNLALGSHVPALGDYVFSTCRRLKSVTIPDSVISIGSGTFLACGSLTNLIIGSHVVSFGASAFESCEGLASVTIPDSVEDIGRWAFGFCSGLTNVTIGRNVSNVGQWAFGYCPKLPQLYFPGNAPTVNGGAGDLDNTVFYNELGTVYYVPGTTGWAAVFGGWPTAPWYQPQPQILGPASGLGVQSNGFQFTISWATNTAVVVETSTDLENWTPVATNTLVNGTNAFTDPAWTNYLRQFYRARSL